MSKSTLSRWLAEESPFCWVEEAETATDGVGVTCLEEAVVTGAVAVAVAEEAEAEAALAAARSGDDG